MAVLSNDNSVRVKVSSSADTKGIKDTSAALGDLNRHSDDASTKSAVLAKAATGLKVAFAATAAATTAFGFASVKSAGNFEQSRMAFEVMLGSAEKARGLMGDIAEFAKTTPFELPDVVAGTKQLLAFGFAQENLLPTMRKLGDIAAGVGVPVGQLTNVFGQVRVAGRLMGGELLQFTNAGVPMIEYLSKVLGVAQEDIKKMVEKGEIGFKDVETAINLMTEEGGKFGGMMDKQSQTFQGVVSNIQDGFGKIMRSAVGMTEQGDIIKGGFFDKLKDAAFGLMGAMEKIDYAALTQGFTNVMDTIITFGDKAFEVALKVGDYLKPKLDELWKSVEYTLMPALTRLWKEVLEPLLPVIGGALVGMIGLAIDATTLLSDTLAVLVQGFLYVWQEVENGNPIMWALVGLFGTLATAMMMKAGFAAITAGLTTLRTVTIPATMLKVGALRALIAGPIGFGAIAIGGALFALAKIRDAANEAHRAINEAQSAVENKSRSDAAALQHAKNQLDSGKWSRDQYDRIVQSIGSNAQGTRNWGGGLTWVGEQGPELVELPKGSKVYDNRESGQMAEKQSAGAVTINQTNNIYNQIDLDAANRELGWRVATA